MLTQKLTDSILDRNQGYFKTKNDVDTFKTYSKVVIRFITHLNQFPYIKDQYEVGGVRVEDLQNFEIPSLFHRFIMPRGVQLLTGQTPDFPDLRKRDGVILYPKEDDKGKVLKYTNNMPLEVDDLKSALVYLEGLFGWSKIPFNKKKVSESWKVVSLDTVLKRVVCVKGGEELYCQDAFKDSIGFELRVNAMDMYPGYQWNTPVNLYDMYFVDQCNLGRSAPTEDK